VAAFGRVIKVQPLANLARLDPNGSVVARIVCRRPTKYIDPDTPLFERITSPLKRVLNYISEKLAAALAGAKDVACKDPAQLVPD
jgi:hypothetical protein